MSNETVSPHEFNQATKNRDGVLLVDVRTPMEFSEVHVQGAHNIPLDRLTPEAIEDIEHQINLKPASQIYFICKSGGRGRQACQKLKGMPREKLVNVEGGTNACIEAGIPVNRNANPTTISLERQVRIAAGGLSVLGVALGLLVHPYLLGISAFVGTGLVFAGITDTCGMGLLLAKMPWNNKTK